jgi:hypothetical protein
MTSWKEDYWITTTARSWMVPPIEKFWIAPVVCYHVHVTMTCIQKSWLKIALSLQYLADCTSPFRATPTNDRAVMLWLKTSRFIVVLRAQIRGCGRLRHILTRSSTFRASGAPTVTCVHRVPYVVHRVTHAVQSHLINVLGLKQFVLRCLYAHGSIFRFLVRHFRSCLVNDLT